MTTTQRDAQALVYIATRLRAETRGCGQWDDVGTYSVIRELIGQNLAEVVHRVIGHAVDPDAKTPGSIRRPFVPKRTDEPGRRQPAKAGEDCKRHPGEYVGSCRACAVERLDAPTDPIVVDGDTSAGRALLASIRERRGVIVSAEALEVAQADGDLGLGWKTDRVGVWPDDGRPETACSAEGCYRPTTDGICDRCRAKALADDEQAANADLVARLKAQDAARAHARPEPSPEPPRHFTSADYDPERVRAAMARRTERTDT